MREKRTDWVLLFFIFAFFASLAGVLYSFRFLISAIIIFIAYLLAGPRKKKSDKGYDALQKVQDWEENGGKRPSEDTFRDAADWFMYSIETIRKEDLDSWKGVEVPAGVRRYIKSEKDLPRQKGIIF